MNQRDRATDTLAHSLTRFALVTFTLGSLGLAHAAGEKADLPQVKVGDRWKEVQKDKRTGATEAELVRIVTSVGPDLVQGTENGQPFRMTPELNNIETSQYKTTGDPRYHSFPMEVGKKWSFKHGYEWKTNPNRGAVSLDAEVVAYEKITVPAGTFDAFRIVADGFYSNEYAHSNGRAKWVYWYAPATRSIVRSDYEDGYFNFSRQLVEYELKP